MSSCLYPPSDKAAIGPQVNTRYKLPSPPSPKTILIVVQVSPEVTLLTCNAIAQNRVFTCGVA